MKAYKTEIKPTKSQIELIHQTCGNVRYIYNKYISDNLKHLKNNEPIISGYDYSKMINHDQMIPSWLKAVSSKALKQAIMNASAALRSYLSGRKGKPNFKKKSKDNSFYETLSEKTRFFKAEMNALFYLHKVTNCVNI